MEKDLRIALTHNEFLFLERKNRFASWNFASFSLMHLSMYKYTPQGSWLNNKMEIPTIKLSLSLCAEVGTADLLVYSDISVLFSFPFVKVASDYQRLKGGVARNANQAFSDAIKEKKKVKIFSWYDW